MDETIDLLDKLRFLLEVLEERVPKPLAESKEEGDCRRLYNELKKPKEEVALFKELGNLKNEWLERVRTSSALSSFAEDFNMDGFYPFYTCQKPRILFVGREACWLKGDNYINAVFQSIKNDNFNLNKAVGL